MSTARRRSGLLVIAALAVSACAPPSGGAPGATPSSGGPADGTGLTLQMEARNDSGQDGTATLTPTADGKTRVLIELANSPGGPQPSHINAGACDDLGEIIYILGGMRGGRVEATVDVSLDSLLAGEFSVSIAKSPQEFGVTASCAEITG